MVKKISKEFVFAVGRRKEAVARVRLYQGKGESVVNAQPIEKYFSGEVSKVKLARAFAATGTEGKFWVSVKVSGGGIGGQLDATVLGIARALNTLDREKFRSPLKKQGLLTRDARERERRKIGTGGRARRQKQSPRR